MKRCLFVILCAALLLALPAAADVAYMPEDSFLEKHREDCSYVGRWYWTNGAEGYVLAHKTPDSAEATPLPNGGKYYISSVYKGKWGVLEYDPGTLEKEYLRDKNAGLPIDVPKNYYPDDDDTQPPLMSWRAHANLLYSNWLNYFVYQNTPYDLSEIQDEQA